MGIRGAIEDIQPFAELSNNATTLVYKAYQQSLERFVLLKRLQPEFSADEDLSARFQEEARLIARVPHPNIVSVYSYGSDADGAYIVAEYVDGKDLEALVEEGRIPPAVALFILSESARGLKAAHDKGILHRDLKPSNILVSSEGEVKLSDFGLASVAGAPAESGEIRGTLPYLAPEHVRGHDADSRSDLFSLGAVFYELLTGRRAFAGTDPSEILDNVLHHDPQPLLAATPGVEQDVERICARLMAKDPSQRYRDADELLDDVSAVQERSERRASQGELKTFLDDPDAYVAAASPNVVVWKGAVEGSGDPEVMIVPDEPRQRRTEDSRSQRSGTASRRWRRAVLVAAAFTMAAGIIYAGTVMLGGDERSLDDGRSAQETPLSGTMDSYGSADRLDTAAVGVDDAAAAESENGFDGGINDRRTDDAGGASIADVERPVRSAARGPEHAESSDEDVVARGDEDGVGSGEDDIVGNGEEDRVGSGEENAIGRSENEPASLKERQATSDVVQSDERRGDDSEFRVDRQEGSPAVRADETLGQANGYGHLQIRVDPAAAVFLNGDSIGTASGSRAVSVDVTSGVHTLTLKNRHFPTHTQQVTVLEEEENLVQVSLFDLVGRLDLRVRPWAVVYVDGDSLGVTPFNPPILLTPGVHRIRLVHEQLDVDHTVNLTIEKGRTMRRDFDLTRLP